MSWSEGLVYILNKLEHSTVYGRGVKYVVRTVWNEVYLDFVSADQGYYNLEYAINTSIHDNGPFLI